MTNCILALPERVPGIAYSAEFESVAIAKGVNAYAALAAAIDSCAHAIAQRQKSGYEIGVEMPSGIQA